ncbi:hypothetical protein AB0D65_29775 [Streptomyces griseoloalbus]|uniref:Uncharacterized protein n=1 Tax=Streptomyces griseoloalbus TaxID=67303 RepID=A0ABV3ED69_9ACTN
MSTTTFTLPDIVTALNGGFGMAAAETPLTIAEPRFTLPMAATLAHLNDPDVKWADVALTYATVRAQIEAEHEMTVPEDDGRTWTRDQVADAVNWAIDEAAGTRRLGACADDLDNLAVNAVLTLLDDPDATFEDVATECYGEDPDEIARWARDAA